MQYTKSMRLTNSNKLYTIFLIWWFVPIYITLLKIFFDPSLMSMLRNVVYIILLLYALTVNHGRISKKFCIFIVSYISIFFINLIFINYKYYAVIEAIPSLIFFSTPVYIFSVPNFRIINLLEKWYKWCAFHTLTVPICVLLKNTGLTSYGDIASITTLNLTILIYTYFKLHKNKMILFCIFINFISLFLFGSRAPLIATVIVAIFLYIFPLKEKKLTQIVIIIVLTIIFIYIILNLVTIMTSFRDILTQYGIESRTITKFVNDLSQNLKITDMAESSGRERIWSIAIEYIKTRYGMPSGFGVIRHLTDGKIYFSHNLFLDMYIVLGIFIVPVFITLFQKLRKARKTLYKAEYQVCLTFGLYFFVSSMTGAHFLGDPYAIVVWGILFFYL